MDAIDGDEIYIDHTFVSKEGAWKDYTNSYTTITVETLIKMTCPLVTPPNNQKKRKKSRASALF
jgi:hypothetical protein